MKNKFRFSILLIVSMVPAFLHAQTEQEQGWSFSQRFQGSANATGVILKTDSTAGYTVNRHVKAYLGVPVYFARASNASFMNGIGNAYGGIVASVDNPTLNYSSDFLVTVPTGDKSRGFSTGRPTVDWTNTVSRSFGPVTPFGSIGLANTISDTAFFVRPFSSKGVVTHFEAGALLPIAPRLSVGASGYGVRAAGEQVIISRIVEPPQSSNMQTTPNGTNGSPTQNLLSSVARGLNSGRGRGANTGVFEERYETVSTASIANDHGLSTWVTLRPTSSADLQIGYSRSVTYDFNSLFFGVGFHFGH